MVRLSPLAEAHPVLAKAAAFYRMVSAGPGMSKMERHRERLYRLDMEKDYAITYAGLLPRIMEECKKQKVPVTARMAQPAMVFEPDISVLDKAAPYLRDGQHRMAAYILTHDRCQLRGITGSGKTTLIKLLIQAFPHPDCRMVIAAPTVTLVDKYYRDLYSAFPKGAVTQLGGGYTNDRGRIIVTTYASLPRVTPEKTYMLFADEVHVAGSPSVHSVLSGFVHTRMYGFSASTNARGDGSNLAVESIFGREMVDISYKEGVAEGYTPEVDTYFYRYTMPRHNWKAKHARERHLIWRNPTRNRLIAAACAYWDRTLREADNGSEPQIMVLTQTVEHAYYLKHLMPEYTVIYSTMNDDTKEHLIKQGIIPPDYKPLNQKGKIDLVRMAGSGALRKIIATSTMGTGEDLPQLSVVFRADGKRREIDNIQYRGRVMRGNRGIYCDIWDEGDGGFRTAAVERMRSAKRVGMKPKIIDLWNNHAVVKDG